MIKGYVKTRLVYVDEKELSLKKSLKIFPHSPTGFAWGYSGSGPAQLALAILLLFCDKDEVIRLHQDFKSDIIAKLNHQRDFIMTKDTIKRWLWRKKKGGQLEIS